MVLIVPDTTRAGVGSACPVSRQLGTRDRSPLGLAIGLRAEAGDARKGSLLRVVTNQERGDAKSVM